MQQIRCILILGCFTAAIGQWFVLLIVFLDLVRMANKVGLGPGLVSLGRSGLFAFFVGSAGLISLCFVARRGLPAGSLERGAAKAVIGALAAGIVLLVLALCTPYTAIGNR